MLNRLTPSSHRSANFWKILRTAAPYAFVLCAAAIFLLLVEWEKKASYEGALSTYRHDASVQSRRAATQVEAIFRQIYQGLRTLARLPGIRSIDRYARNFDANARSSAQEIYNNLSENVAISEVYVVPLDFDPDSFDPNTGKLQEPVTTFDELIVGRTADSQKRGSSHRDSGQSQIGEIEIYEYRLMKKQLAVLKERFPRESQINRLSYPAIAGPEVITCDNTRYSPSHPDDRDRMGLVYSVPFYDEEGALRGIVSAIILTAAVAEILPSEGFVLSNARYHYKAAPNANISAVAQSDNAADPNSGLLYSEVIPLDVKDLTGGWTLWAGLNNRNYWSSAGAISAEAKASTQQITVVVTAIIFCIIIFGVTEKYRAEQRRGRELEACIVERTGDLAEATEVAKSANRAKSRFLSIMSHEIRTPMTAIMGMADLLSQSRLGRQEDRYVHVIQNAADTLLNIVNDILDVSKIEAGKIELHPGPFAVDQIISDVIGMFAEQVQTKHLRLISEVDENIPSAICVDGIRLRQVLINLVGNAVKFTKSGEIRVSAKAGDTDRDGRTKIQFTVSDTGIGIARDTGDAVFEPFGHSHESLTTRFGGTGLGLSISRNLVEIMGGEIRYESTPGKGTTFYFDISVEVAAAAAIAPAPADGAAAAGRSVPEADLRGASILLAEDNPVNQEVIREYLERLGASVVVAEDGSKAVVMASHRRFDAILMDCQMPEMDGFEATRRIREHAAKAGKECAPIVALTADAFVEDRARCLNAGMTDYLSKPFTAACLRQTLAKHMKRAATAPASQLA